MELTDNIKQDISALLKRYPSKNAVIIPALHIIRRERINFSNSVMEELANLLDVHPIKIREVTTFYPMFQVKDFGKHIIQVCSTLSCSMLGSRHIVEYLEKKLNIKTGQTTPDRRFTLLKAECLAACGTAPVMQVNEKYYESLTESKIDKILGELD